jgi:hypothetical protein
MTSKQHTYGTAETRESASVTLCHVARNPTDVWNVKSLCGVGLSWIIGEYSDTPSGWNLCRRCASTRVGRAA